MQEAYETMIRWSWMVAAHNAWQAYTRT